MRTAYRQQLDSFAHDLIIMCDIVGNIMRQASKALLSSSLQSAEDALSAVDELEEVRVRCEEAAVALLALETPLARDLRQVVSSIYIVEDFNRMGALAMHIARSARRRYPDHTVPEDIRGFFSELARLTEEMVGKTRSILIDPNVDVALALSTEDDAVDDIHNHLMTLLTTREWKHSTHEAVDASLLARYYERYADHTVNVAARIVYLTTGLSPDQYLIKREQEEAEQEVTRKWEELERQFRSGGSV